MNYSELVAQHFFNPRNIGEIADDFPFISKAQAGGNSIGEKVVLYVACNADGKIQAARYKVFGNPYTIAAMSLLSEQLPNLDITQAAALNYQELIQQLEIPITKQHCALIAVDAVHAAVAQLQQQINK